ncbi:MAG: PD-(D/E)XK nuclease family protein, partial [Nitrospira sp.]|nr:PD-(D/E)XK nuclease family protein [Nitrospira sp.]
YRTLPPVLEAGNYIFDSILFSSDPAPWEARPQPMAGGRVNVEGSAKPTAAPGVEVALLEQLQGQRQGDGDVLQRPDDEAEWIAQRARGLRDEGVSLSEIAILVRRRTNVSQIRAAFARHGLPLLVHDEGSLFETQEAQDCLNLLRVLANPRDDAAALGFLRSPFAGFSDRGLTEVALGAENPDANLLERVRLSKAMAAADSRARRSAFFLLDALAQRAGREPPSVLLAEALSMSGYSLAVGCGPQGEQRLANVEAMRQVVRDTQAYFATLGELVRELNRRAEAGDREPMGELPEDAEGVKLMTIHAAKGMEFPVVFVTSIGSTGHLGNNGILRTAPLGEGLLGLHLPWEGIDDAGSLRPDLAAFLAARERKLREEAEAKRVFYVAYTRARDRLILCGATRRESNMRTWAGQLLGALGSKGYGDSPSGLPDGIALEWLGGIDRAEPVSTDAARRRVAVALEAGEIALPRPVELSLTKPVAEKPAPPMRVDPAAVEIGTLVHAAIEEALNSGDGFETGVLNVPEYVAKGVAAEVERQARNALEALATLTVARVQHPEQEIHGPSGARRIDLLRELGDGRYEIVDFKSDSVEAGMLDSRAREAHGAQLRDYADTLREYLAADGREVGEIHAYVCFTAPQRLKPAERLVEVAVD